MDMEDIDMARNLDIIRMNSMEIIAEIGQAHDGSLGILYSYIDALAETGVDTIKFQVHIAEAESSLEEPFRIPFSYQDSSRFDYWQRMEFSASQWHGIKGRCEAKGVQFLASPFSIAAVELLESIGAKRYKIGSGEVSNYLMLEKIARLKKPVILSSGMSSFHELESACAVIEKYHSDISIMQCTTAYPTPPERIGFNLISVLKQKFPNFKIGLSEHTSNNTTGIASCVLGAELLEFHAVFDKRMFGPDSSSSLEINEIADMVESIRYIEKALANPVEKDDLKPYEELKPIFEKSLAVNKTLEAGHVLVFEDLESKKPANKGISARDFAQVIGKKLSRKLERYSFLTSEDIEGL